MKTAIVYDWIDKWGGVERLLLTLHEMFPDAQWYTSYYSKKGAPWADKLHIQTSFLQKLPRFIRKNRIVSSILYPYAFESFDLSEYDLVISVTSSFAKSVITKPGTKHICYLLTPPRYMWGMTDQYLKGWKKGIASFFLTTLRKWDYIAAQRPDRIVSLSDHVAKRCEKYYHRSSTVLYPPFDSAYWQKIDKEKILHTLPAEFYLVVSRLEPYKKVKLAIEACNRLKKNLVIVGTGSMVNELKNEASSYITFIDSLTDGQLATIYSQAKALLIPQEEDFGYVSLEAQALSCPIVAYENSGIAETILHSSNAILFKKQTVTSLQEALERFEDVAYNVDKGKRVKSEFPETYSKAHFINTFLSYIT